MSILLALIPVLLISCILVCYALALRRPNLIQVVATAVVSVVLIIWLVIGQRLPIMLGEPVESEAMKISLWFFRVDEIAWQLSLSLLILIESLFLVGLPRLLDVESNKKLPVKQQILIPTILLLVVVSLLGLWLVSGPGLLVAWTSFALIWLIFLWLVAGEQVQLKDLFLRTGLLLLGTLFLWLAFATMEDPFKFSLSQGGWTTQSMFWAMLAITVQFGAIPLHWWRPLDWSINSSWASIVHLLPGVLGSALLAHLLAVQVPGSTSLFFTTIFGLLGLLVGLTLAWTHLDDSLRIATGLVLAQAGMVILIGSWVGSAAVIGQSRVIILALGSLFIAAEIPRQPYRWNMLVPLAALAGVPLTAGFVSLAALYSSWLTGISFLLAIVAVLLYIPFIAAALISFWAVAQKANLSSIDRLAQLRRSIGLLLPALGLLSLPVPIVIDLSLWSLLPIIFAAAGGIALGIIVRRNSEIQSDLRHAFRIKLPGRREAAMFIRLGRGLANSIRTVTMILEGEGGFLWLLLFIVLFWIAVSG